MKKLLTIIAAVLAINCQAQQPTITDLKTRLDKAGEYMNKSANQTFWGLGVSLVAVPATYASFRYSDKTTGYVVGGIGFTVSFTLSLSAILNYKRGAMSLQGYAIYDGTTSPQLPSSYTP